MPLPLKIEEQIRNAGLPAAGAFPFEPLVVLNQRGESEIRKRAATYGRKRGKRGYVDTQGRIWIRDWAHGPYPDHWDVQIDDGQEYIRVNDQGDVVG